MRYAVQSDNSKMWFAEYFDWRRNYFGMVENTEPIDYKRMIAEMKK